MYTLTLDFSPRHCWDNRCDEANDLTHHGPTEFIRWIRAFGRLAPGIVTEFKDGWLRLGQAYNPIINEQMYCENYGDLVLAFLDTENGKAYVAVFDETLLPHAAKALKEVTLEYAVEETERVSNS